MSWSAWIASVWLQLVGGSRMLVPEDLGDAELAGFRPLPIAQKVGQVRDFALSLKDGSRLHLHEFSSGARVLHRDKLDPARGVHIAVAHWLTESQSGRAVVAYAAPRIFRAAVRALK